MITFRDILHHGCGVSDFTHNHTLRGRDECPHCGRTQLLFHRACRFTELAGLVVTIKTPSFHRVSCAPFTGLVVPSNHHRFIEFPAGGLCHACLRHSTKALGNFIQFPHGSGLGSRGRFASCSPKLQFYDTWWCFRRSRQHRKSHHQ